MWHETSTMEAADEQATKTPSHSGGRLSAYTLVHTSSNEHYLVWTIHHALYDGWSIPFMLQKVEKIYQTGMSGVPTVPYTRFIKYLQDSDMEASRKFWRDNLSGAAPYQFPQQPHSTSNTGPHGQVLQHTAKLSSHPHSDITPSTIIRAAWALLLSAYTGSEDVVFGETLTGRDISVPGITEICGPTLTTVPTRVTINQDMRTADLLSQISRNATDRIPFQHLGLSEIKKLDDDTAAACNFQNLLAIQTGGQQPAETMWKFHNSGIQKDYFTYPLVIECKAEQKSVGITAYFDENTLSAWQVQRILYQLEFILGQLSSVSKISDINIFSEQDMQLVRKWNSYEPLTISSTIHSLFLQQAAARPHAIAVSAFDGEFTYAELRGLASRFASKLIELGAGPEIMVPICFDKSKWAVVAIMSILLSGAAYVPLSPQHPAERHRQIITDCNAKVILCSPAYGKRFAAVVPTVMSVSETSVEGLEQLGLALPVRANGSNMCYVLYTSGSTGTPKGVVVEHQAIASSSAAICKSLHMDSSSRVFQFGSFVFDASVMEILTTLTCGATICIPSEEERTADIASAINKSKSTWACLTPSVANVIESPAAVPTLKTFASGAEALTSETIKKWSSGLELLNAYGPTEASVVAVANEQVATQRDPSNIGHMLQSGRAWIVKPDNPHQLAPLSAVGELAIEGPLLARGYLGNRVKTAEAFVENPAFMKDFTQGASHTRIYRTGDLVQYAEDGSIRYQGRKDNQIKIYGQRIELGDCEQNLQAVEQLQTAVVVVPKSGPGKGKLTAVVTLRGNPADSNIDEFWNTPITNVDVLKQVAGAKDRLSEILPSYMVPTVWVAVKKIPTLASSKIDRKQVCAWFESMDDSTYRQIMDLEESGESDIQSTETTKTLQTVWAKVLNIPVENVKLNKSWLCKFTTHVL